MDLDIHHGKKPARKTFDIIYCRVMTTDMAKTCF